MEEAKIYGPAKAYNTATFVGEAECYKIVKENDNVYLQKN